MTSIDPADAKILIVDDERANVLLLERLLQRAGYRRLASTTDSRTVLELYRNLQPDLILLDLDMPNVNGFDVLHKLREKLPPNAFLPVLVLSGGSDSKSGAWPEAERTKRKSLAGGATDFQIGRAHV